MRPATSHPRRTGAAEDRHSERSVSGTSTLTYPAIAHDIRQTRLDLAPWRPRARWPAGDGARRGSPGKGIKRHQRLANTTTTEGDRRRRTVSVGANYNGSTRFDVADSHGPAVTASERQPHRHRDRTQRRTRDIVAGWPQRRYRDDRLGQLRERHQRNAQCHERQGRNLVRRLLEAAAPSRRPAG